MSMKEDRHVSCMGCGLLAGKKGTFSCAEGKIEAKVCFQYAEEIADLADRANQYRFELLEQMVYG